MKVAFRTDASLQIGIGHVMRCLTLADALAAKGADCQFICRGHEGNMIEFIRGKGYIAHALPVAPEAVADSIAPEQGASTQGLAHHHWLGATQAEDANACTPILAALQPDWLIVDHYALDACWELALRPHINRLMVIDDLADRPHACDVLLDQTFGREADDYRAWVPAHCRLLCGSQYALLRPEFIALRPYSLQRRASSQVRRLLVTMGGIDNGNATGQVLEALRACSLPDRCEITVVLGANSPWQAEVARQAQDMPWPTEVMVGVGDMACLMANSDLAIGAAGATSWERCCLGLPTVTLLTADNQIEVARGLEAAGAALIIEKGQGLAGCLSKMIARLIEQPSALSAMSHSATRIVDGRGAETVARYLET